MNLKQISRRNFLKLFASAAVGTFLFPLERLLNSKNSRLKNNSPAREAKYYKSADKLAG